MITIITVQVHPPTGLMSTLGEAQVQLDPSHEHKLWVHGHKLLLLFFIGNGTVLLKKKVV